ncbi:MAG: NYN domain-containing protein [Chloroflexi bacterium]|nr:NYN domain-containing protein [Chloroflexota bacterium]
MIKRVIIFIDAQNMYRSAREAFYDAQVSGQYDPMLLARHILDKKSPPEDERSLEEVRIYTGRPHPDRDPKTHAAHMRQCDAWTRAGVKVIWRPLRYLSGERPQEKGIDVQIAIDVISLATDNRYDIGIVASADTDLMPALQFVLNRFGATRKMETVTWSAPGYRRGLFIPRFIWCHNLDLQDYMIVRDPVNYAAGL